MLQKLTIFIVLVSVMSPLHADEEQDEFDAILQAPFLADARGEREVKMHFSVPPGGHQVRWRLTLLPRHDATAVRNWHGVVNGTGEVAFRWRSDVPQGVYRMRLLAQLDGGGEVEQAWPVAVTAPTATARSATLAGPAAARLSATLAATPTPAASRAAVDGMPYDVYLGNLHSQTNHSDGGGALAACTGAQAPQSGTFGPADAYAYAGEHGLDFLMTSEHNHMYDGSDGTNPAADAGAARALFRAGLRQATQWRDSHPGFLALYGQEWGVISHGGHLNLLNADVLLGWERNANNELLADEDTPKNDYGQLYRTLREHRWFGQFNHPQRDQFAIGGQPLAWSADGDATMLLCEVMNSSAYSNRTDEGEPRHSNFESACNALLEAGYHVAFSSNQDNHCANWGSAYSNRTAVLLPRSTALTPSSLLDALQARRVYATMDKHSQLIFTANGHMMGERIQNRGRLTLKTHYASASGHRVAAISIVHGVPGRQGSVASVGMRPAITLKPLPGEHFYYARVTQDDGKMLWSAPIWVTQLPHSTAVNRAQ